MLFFGARKLSPRHFPDPFRNHPLPCGSPLGGTLPKTPSKVNLGKLWITFDGVFGEIFLVFFLRHNFDPIPLVRVEIIKKKA